MQQLQRVGLDLRLEELNLAHLPHVAHAARRSLVGSRRGMPIEDSQLPVLRLDGTVEAEGLPTVLLFGAVDARKIAHVDEHPSGLHAAVAARGEAASAWSRRTAARWWQPQPQLAKPKGLAQLEADPRLLGGGIAHAHAETPPEGPDGVPRPVAAAGSRAGRRRKRRRPAHADFDRGVVEEARPSIGVDELHRLGVESDGATGALQHRLDGPERRQIHQCLALSLLATHPLRLHQPRQDVLH